MGTIEDKNEADENYRRASTSVSTIHVDDDGVVCWTYRQGAVVNLPEAQEEVGVVGVLVDRVLGTSELGNPQGNKVPLLIDIRSVRSVARNARELLVSDEVSTRWHVSGLALLIKSSISKMLGNVTLAWQRPKHPIRLFTDAGRAKKWLLEQPPVATREA